MGNNTTDAPTIFQNKSCTMAQMWKRDGEPKKCSRQGTWKTVANR